MPDQAAVTTGAQETGSHSCLEGRNLLSFSLNSTLGRAMGRRVHPSSRHLWDSQCECWQPFSISASPYSTAPCECSKCFHDKDHSIPAKSSQWLDKLLISLHKDLHDIRVVTANKSWAILNGEISEFHYMLESSFLYVAQIRCNRHRARLAMLINC